MNLVVFLCLIFLSAFVNSEETTHSTTANLISTDSSSTNSTSSNSSSVEEHDAFNINFDNLDARKEFWDRINHNGARRGLNLCTKTTNLRCPSNLNKVSWKCYNSYKTILAWLRTVSIDFKNRLELKTIGITFEKRPIQAVLIKQNTSGLPIIFVEAGMYGNEWGSTSFALYLINKIVYEKDLSVLESWIADPLFKKHNWFIVPVLNPDGYEYAYNNDITWEKNRSPPHGTNINRNFDVDFGVFDSSNNVEDNTYSGVSPFSEAESRAIKESVESLGPKLKMYLSYHDYYKARFTIPYKDGMMSLQSYDDLAHFMGKRAQEIKRRVGSDDRERWWDWSVNKASGESWQWVNKFGKKYQVKTFQIGLNPGLLSEVRQPMPPELIEHTCKSALETLAFMVEGNQPQQRTTSTYRALSSAGHTEMVYFAYFITSCLSVLIIK